VITVHSFEVWDQPSGQFVRQPSKRTTANIEEIGEKARMVAGTAEPVEPSMLDAYDRYYPRYQTR
jgi:hypothetical protein